MKKIKSNIVTNDKYFKDSPKIVKKKYSIILIVMVAVFGIGVYFTVVDPWLNPKGLAFEKIGLSSETQTTPSDNISITADQTAKITINIKNYNQVFHDIKINTTTDDSTNEFHTLDHPLLLVSSLDRPNKNTGDNYITITPHNIKLDTTPLTITVEVYANNTQSPIISHVLHLTITKK